MFHDDGYALLLGIDDYSAFDRSTGEAPGTSSLEGSLNDVHVFYRLCTQLGLRPENIRVLTSPRIDLALLPGAAAASVGEATEEGVRAAIAWLADKLAGGRAGLLTYSGHGAHTNDKGLLLCPSDVIGAGFDHAIPFTALRALLGDAAKNLTVVLDCCHGGAHGGADMRGRRTSTLGGDPIPAGGRRSDLHIGARVLAACEPGQTTQQATFDGLARGAFSWGLASVADQWKGVDEGGNVRLDLSYGTLIDKVGKLLALLDFPGTPAIYGPDGVESLAVMQVGSRPETTTAAPDGARHGVQMDSGERDFRYYTMTDPVTGALVANVLVARNAGTMNGVDYKTGTEYWFTVATSKPTNGMIVTWLDYGWSDPTLPTPGTLSFTMVEAATWRSMGAGYPGQSSSNLASSSAGVVLVWKLSYSGRTGWSGSLQWFDQTGENNVFSGTMPAGGVTLAPNTAVGAAATWYSASVSATNAG